MCRAKISGGFGAPYLTAIVILPRLNISQETTFLVDTGADSTAVSGVTSLGLGIHPFVADPGLSISETTTTGAGGDSTSYTVYEPALMAFEEYDEERDVWSLHVEHIGQIGILPNAPDNLLGRDIINRFTMDYRPDEGHAEMVRDDFGGGSYECHTYDDQPSDQIQLGNGGDQS